MTSPTPPRLPIPGAWQGTLKFTQSSQEGAIVLGFAGVNAMDAADAALIRDAVWSSFRPLISSAVTCTGFVLRDTSGPDLVPIEVGPPASNAAGAGTGTTVAAGCTLIRWTTATGGRTGRGRTFLPGLPSGAVQPQNGRLYEAAHNTLTATAVTNYLTGSTWNTVAAVPAVLSFRRGLARPILAGSISPVIGIQRRRMR